MKNILHMVLAVLTAVLLAGCYQQQIARDSIFQTSTLGALSEGLYDGDITIREMKKFGDTGLGTLNGLDGEMIALDGKFYQVKYDGRINDIDEKSQVPFALVKFFQADLADTINTKTNYSELIKYLDSRLPTRNIFYAVKITGFFDFIKTRSVAKQSKPYPRLIDAVNNQSIFEFKNIKGTIIGFRFPEFAAGINMSGYHLHFVAADKRGGGHLLDCMTSEAKIELDFSHQLYMIIPQGDDFYKINLQKAKEKELEKIEK